MGNWGNTVRVGGGGGENVSLFSVFFGRCLHPRPAPPPPPPTPCLSTKKKARERTPPLRFELRIFALLRGRGWVVCGGARGPGEGAWGTPHTHTRTHPTHTSPPVKELLLGKQRPVHWPMRAQASVFRGSTRITETQRFEVKSNSTPFGHRQATNAGLLRKPSRLPRSAVQGALAGCQKIIFEVFILWCGRRRGPTSACRRHRTPPPAQERLISCPTLP